VRLTNGCWRQSSARLTAEPELQNSNEGPGYVSIRKQRAAPGAHSLTMNLTIWAEAVTAAVALCVTLGLTLYHVRLSAHALMSTFTYERPSASAARAQERRTSTHRQA
jgi:hypothetical protein